MYYIVMYYIVMYHIVYWNSRTCRVRYLQHIYALLYGRRLVPVVHMDTMNMMDMNMYA